MNLKEYQPLALRTAKMYPTQAQNLTHAALGLASEFLEGLVADDASHFKEEIGDYCWYLPLACHALNTTLDRVAPYGTLQAPPSTSTRDLGIKSTGDFISMVKRVVIYEKPLTPEMMQQAMHDIRGMLMYASSTCIKFGFSLNEALDSNIAKLRIRFPDAYSNKAAEGRADKAGEDARVS